MRVRAHDVALIGAEARAVEKDVIQTRTLQAFGWKDGNTTTDSLASGRNGTAAGRLIKAEVTLGAE